MIMRHIQLHDHHVRDVWFTYCSEMKGMSGKGNMLDDKLTVMDLALQILTTVARMDS